MFLVKRDGDVEVTTGGRTCGGGRNDVNGVYERFVEKNKKRLDEFWGTSSRLEKRSEKCLASRSVLYMGVAADCTYG